MCLALILAPKVDSKFSTTVQGENFTSEVPVPMLFREKHTLVLIFPWWSINSSLLFIYFLYFLQSADSPRAWLWRSPKGSIYETSKPKGREELVDIPMTTSYMVQAKMEVVRNILLWMMIQNKIVKVVMRKCEIACYWKISSVGVKAFRRSVVMQQIFLTDECHNKSF